MVNKLISNKKKTESQMSVLFGILDAQDNDVVIVNRHCEILHMNYAARSHFSGTAAFLSCKNCCADRIPELCGNCPNKRFGMFNRTENIEIADKNGIYYSARYCAIRWIDGSLCTAIFLHNIDEEHSVQEKLYSLAYIDQLTGIANRTKLREDLDETGERIIISKTSGALAIFDLDNFKTINDNYGHNVGDIMLKRLTSHLENDEDFKGHLYRLGGDEFVLLFKDTNNRFQSLNECRNYYHRLLSGTMQSYTLPHIEARCTISMGVSFFPWHGHGFSDLLRKADIALYRAKANGKNQICFFDDGFDTMQSHGFRDIYINIQPVMDHKTRVVGVN